MKFEPKIYFFVTNAKNGFFFGVKNFQMKIDFVNFIKTKNQVIGHKSLKR